MPTYRAVPFEPEINRERPSASAATTLQDLINQATESGWEFVGIENHSTIVPGTIGCFGLGAMSPYPKTMSIAVFRR